MRDPSTDHRPQRPRRLPALAVVAIVVAVAAVAAASVLWMRHGTSVFFAMVAAGIAACF
jgi:hypothetical protein